MGDWSDYPACFTQDDDYLMFKFIDIVNVSRRKVWSSQSRVELSRLCSCTGCLVVWMSQCKVTHFVCGLCPYQRLLRRGYPRLMSSWEVHVPFVGTELWMSQGM